MVRQRRRMVWRSVVQSGEEASALRASVIDCNFSGIEKQPANVSIATLVYAPRWPTVWPLADNGMLRARAFSNQASWILRALPWDSTQTSQPPSKPAHSTCTGVDMINRRSSTQAAT